MNEAYRNIIVSDAYVSLARTITETLAPVGGKGMYTTGLSPDGTAPATHWISSGFINADYAQLLPLSAYSKDQDDDWIGGVVSHGYPSVILDMYTAAIQTPPTEENPIPDPVDPGFTLADVEDMLAASDVTLEQPFTAMARLGLHLVNQKDDFQ